MRIRATLFVLVVGCAHPASSPPSSTAAEQLVGMWRLVEVVGVRDDGSTTTSKWGPHPSGYLVYDRSGRMTVQIMGDPRPTFRDAKHPSADEGLAAFESYLAYSGTYGYDPVSRRVTHHLEMSIDPTEVGQDLVREAQLEGDRVVLLAQPYRLRTGEQVRNRLTWERVRAP